MMPSILVASDFSDNAALALERGAQIAKAHAAKLHLLHVVEQDIWTNLAALLGLEPDVEHDLLHNQLSSDLALLAQHMQDHWSIDTQTEIRTGSTTGEMIKTAGECDAILQVIGGHGAGKLRDLAVGSTAERLLRKTSLPTLVVNYSVEKPYEKVLLPVDFSNWSIMAIKQVRDLFPDAEIILMHVATLGYEAQLRRAGISSGEIENYRNKERQKADADMAILAAECKDFGGVIRTYVVAGDIPENLVKVAQSENVDLIAIGKHGHGMIEEWLLGSVTLHVLAGTPCDVLVCTNKDIPGK